MQRLGGGDSSAASELLPLLYEELHALAGRQMRGERADHTLQATALLNEAWLRLVDTNDPEWEDRRHFLRVAARAMRNVLVDHARSKQAQKRGGGKAPVQLEEALALWERDDLDLIALDEALIKLGETDEELMRVVELRFFAGLTLEEAGTVLDKTVRQVHRAWVLAKSWLHRELTRDGAE